MAHKKRLSLDRKQDYNPSLIEKKWQEAWDKSGIYSPNLDASTTLRTKKPFDPSASLRAQGKPFYNLMMFPYPSAEGMHVGNMYAFTGADVYGRFMRMQGNDVFEPIGLDGFGIHSENYAIKVGRHPKEQAKVSESNFYRQLRATGNGFDWSRKLETYDPKYYKWTQWLFIQLFKKGLAYRAKAKVNWCPSCKTVLADEQVVSKKLEVRNGKLEKEVGSEKADRTSHFTNLVSHLVPPTSISVCERCETEVIKKDLEQWFFRITKYANRLLTNLAKLDWSEKVKIAQRQWIGRSEGATIKFSIFNFQFSIEVFTTRPDTLYGATFLVISPEHPIVAEILKESGLAGFHLARLRAYVQEAKKKTEQERLVEGREKTGVFTRLYAINPVNNEKIPIWIADYVLMGYGTGAIMGVPAHDQRDFEFARKYNLPIRQVIIPTKKSAFADALVSQTDLLDDRLDNLEKNITQNDEFVKGVDLPGVEPGRPGLSSRSSKPAKPTPKSAYTGFGILVNSGKYTGLSSKEATERMIKDFESRGVIKKEVSYHLRDWLISRQRYWGPPIPMIYCEKCKWQPVPEKDLPVLLPDVKDWKPLGTGKSPLANHPEFYKVKCPNCGGEAERETDVSDNFLDSAWYFLRYVSTDIDSSAFDIERVKKWLPVEMYIGGAEHSVLHLLYSRFITMVLHDLGLISFEEPFSRFFAHGLLIKERAKMSKSKGNVVVPDEYIKKYGADTLRCYLMFLGPFSQGGDFYDTALEGMFRFLNRVYRLISEATRMVADQNAKKRRSASIGVNNQRQSARVMHKTIKKVTEDISSLRYNTAIAALMEWHNYLKSNINPSADGQKSKITIEEAETFLKLLAPFAPHLTEQLFQQFFGSSKFKVQSSKFSSIHLQPWPTYDPKFLEEDEVTIVVQVNGKARDTMVVQSSTLRLRSGQELKVKSYIEELARKSGKIKKYIEGRTIKKVVYVEGKIINFVTND